MKLKLLILLVCICTIATSFAQTNSPLVLKKKGVFQDEKLLKKKEIKNLLMQYPESAAEYNLAYGKNYKIGTGFVISGATVALIGGGIGLAQSAQGGGSWGPVYVAGAGLGLVLIGAPFMFISNSHLKKSINIYNSKNTTGLSSQKQLEFGLTQNGVGITFHF